MAAVPLLEDVEGEEDKEKDKEGAVAEEAVAEEDAGSVEAAAAAVKEEMETEADAVDAVDAIDGVAKAENVEDDELLNEVGLRRGPTGLIAPRLAKTSRRPMGEDNLSLVAG